MITSEQVKNITSLISSRADLQRALDSQFLAVAHKTLIASVNKRHFYSDNYVKVSADWLRPLIQNRIDEIGKELVAMGYVEDGE